MKSVSSEEVYKKILNAVDQIAERARTFAWQDRETYANWLCQSYYYVSWTTRQLALASAHTRPGSEDAYHWRFIEEAKEEKRHELLALNDLENMGVCLDEYPELPHSSFFYQSLNYMIEREHPLAIIGFALTLEGFAALRASEFIAIVQKAHGEGATSFIRLHGELDVQHFENALPYLKKCPTYLLPIISRSIDLCRTIYIGILDDITNHQLGAGHFLVSQPVNTYYRQEPTIQ